jgi:hypothetical protein
MLRFWINFGPCNVFAIWMTYLLAAVAASGITIAVGWRSKQARGGSTARDGYGLADDPLWGDPEIDISTSDTRTDVGGAVRLALKRLAPLMASQAVKVDVAAPSGLLGRMRGATLADLLEELLTAAIRGAPASRLLLTVAPHGDRIYVGVTDDRPGADPEVRAGAVRGLMERVAMRGGSLDIDVRPAEGTTMTLRLAAVTETWRESMDRAPPEPTKGANLPLMPQY